MAAVAVAERPEPMVATLTPRRFEMPDLSSDGGWAIDRLLKVYKHLNQQQLAGWLRSIVYNNEFLFLWLPHAVALAQIESAHTLSPRPVVREHFVWAHDPKDPKHVAEAAQMYERIRNWAKQQGAATIIVAEQSDVPVETLKQMFERVFERPQKFVRV